MARLLLAASLSPLAASCVSGLASSYLLRRLWQLPTSRRKKLLARQLQQLAAADLVYAVSEIFTISIDIFFKGLLNDRECEVTYVLNNIGFQASLIFECHLALTFGALICKSVRSLRVLSRCLPFVWALAVLLALIMLYLVDYRADGSAFACTCESQDFGFVATICTTLIVCLASYIICSWRVRTAGRPVQRSVWRRAQTYTLVVLLASGPAALYYAQIVPLYNGARDFIAYTVCATLFDLRGLLNFAVYALQWRYAWRLRAKSAAQPEGEQRLGGTEAERDQSWRVTFRETDSVRDVTWNSESDSLGHAGGTSSDWRPLGHADTLFGEMRSDALSWYFWEMHSDGDCLLDNALLFVSEKVMTACPSDVRRSGSMGATDAPAEPGACLQCPACMRPMVFTAVLQGARWKCSVCGARPSYACPERWHCGRCFDDICAECSSKADAAGRP